MSSVSFCGKQLKQKLAYHLSWKGQAPWKGPKLSLGVGGKGCSLLEQEAKQVSTLTELHCET